MKGIPLERELDPDRSQPGTHTEIFHDGRIGTNYNTFVYHKHEPLWMLTVPVAPELIVVEQEWKLD